MTNLKNGTLGRNGLKKVWIEANFKRRAWKQLVLGEKGPDSDLKGNGGKGEIIIENSSLIKL